MTRRSELRQGRTLQALQAETLNIDGYLTVLYWMVARYQDNTGTDVATFSPHAALIVDRCGVLRRFRAVRHSNEARDVTWTPCKQSCDPMQQPYYCHGAVNGRQVGGWVCAYGPELGGTTGEKTALDKYIGVGGTWPGAYLHVWRKHPQVENLMRQGFGDAVTQTIDNYLNMCGNYSMLRDAPNIPWVDWSETKPHRMLGMSKEAFRELRGKHWSEGTARCWASYRMLVKNADALQFAQEVGKLGLNDMEKLLGAYRAVETDLHPTHVVKYLEKQKRLKGGVQLLLDYRRVLRALWLADQNETLWPRDLQAAHDRVMEMYAGARGREVLLGGFYAGLHPAQGAGMDGRRALHPYPAGGAGAHRRREDAAALRGYLRQDALQRQADLLCAALPQARAKLLHAEHRPDAGNAEGDPAARLRQRTPR